MLGNTVSALVDFDFTTGAINGSGQYLVSGSYDPSSGCFGIEFGPSTGSWISDHPLLVPARVVSGELSADMQTITGQLTPSENCNCLGSAPYGFSEGTTCAFNGQSYEWCYVSPTCADASQSAYSGWYTAPCGQYVSCTAIQLSRICSSYRPTCPNGWTRFNNR